VKRAKDAGAKFGVAPGLNLEIIRAAQDLSLPFVPGIMTPSEIENAPAGGVQAFEIFSRKPRGRHSNAQGACRSLWSGGSSVCCFGRVTPANMRDFLDLPIVAAVGGSWLVDPALIAKRDWAGHYHTNQGSDRHR